MSEKGVRSVCAPFQGSKILGGKGVKAVSIPILGQSFWWEEHSGNRHSIFGLTALSGKSAAIVFVFLARVKRF